MPRLKLAAVALGVFGLGYFVCRVGDGLVYSDEERVADRFHAAAEAARARRFSDLPGFAKLAEFGLSASGYGSRHSFGAGDEAKVAERAADAARHAAVETMTTTASEDDVRVENGRAMLRTMLLFTEGGQRYRQPVRVLFRKSGDEWFIAEIDLAGAEEAFRF